VRYFEERSVELVRGEVARGPSIPGKFEKRWPRKVGVKPVEL
jgi:hypothetical protein